jgi:hypothetical protein
MAGRTEPGNAAIYDLQAPRRHGGGAHALMAGAADAQAENGDRRKASGSSTPIKFDECRQPGPKNELKN